MNATPIHITGYAGANPELRLTPAGKATLTLRVAVTDRYRDAGGEWVDGATSWHTVIAWGPLAEHVADAVTKGDRIIVAGRLAQRSYENGDGDKRSVWEITADDIGLSLRTPAATGGASATWEPTPAMA
ncbi:MAG: single-stranded DNA-binding protein [Sporichthyaceae bacterium]